MTKRMKEIENKITALNSDIKAYEAELATCSPARRPIIQARISQANANIATLKSELEYENGRK